MQKEESPQPAHTVLRPVKVSLKLEEGASIPTYATEGAAGADLRANVREPITLGCNESIAVPTGVFLEIPLGYEVQIRPRSGLAFKNQITVLNTPGTIDSDYRGEVKVILINHGKSPFVIEPGMRIAQMVLARVDIAEFVQAGELAESGRGAGGFGSTGVL